MSRSRGGVLTAVVLAGTLAVLGAQTLGPTEPPAGMWLEIILNRAREKPLVWFSHRRHEGKRLACEQCHHDYLGGRNLWHQGQPVRRCQACHGLRPQAQRLDVKNAFHRQCKGCHLKLRQQRRPAGPIQCQECHRQG